MRRDILLALLLGALTAVGVFAVEVENLRANTERTPVVVAARTILSRSVITVDELRIREMVSRDLPARFYTSPDQLVGTVAAATILDGEAVVPERLADRITLDAASALIPPNKPYAFNVPVGLFFSAPPRLVPHDRLDIIGYPRGSSLDKGGVIIADVEIIDISPRSQENVSATSALTLALDGEQIIRLMAARDGYVLGLAVRPYVRATP